MKKLHGNSKKAKLQKAIYWTNQSIILLEMEAKGMDIFSKIGVTAKGRLEIAKNYLAKSM